MAALAEGLEMIRAMSAALLASVALSASLGLATAHYRDKARDAVQELDGAQADAKACSDATEELQKLADKRKAEANAARAAAAKASRTHDARADATLATVPAVPGDMCASMQALGDKWLKGRY